MEMPDDELCPDIIYVDGISMFPDVTVLRCSDRGRDLDDKYHHARILKAKDARIAELEKFIEVRGYEIPK